MNKFSTLTKRALRGVWALGFASATWLVAAACISQPVAQHDRPRRGKLVSVTPLATLEATALVEYLDDFELDTSHVKSGVDAYRLIYGTIGLDGTPTTASSLVVVPHRHDDAFRTAVWMHGTTVYRRDAASVSDDSEDRAAAYFLAGGGYLVTAPDYLGLGKGPGTHPYDHAASEVSAWVCRSIVMCLSPAYHRAGAPASSSRKRCNKTPTGASPHSRRSAGRTT
jgi:hypothetical protein